MTAPKRIIMDFGYTPTADGVALLETWSKPVEYTRTDLIQPMIDAAVAQMKAERDVLKEQLDEAVDAMRKAVLLAEQPHYGDRGDALDHYSEAMDVIRATLAKIKEGKL